MPTMHNRQRRLTERELDRLQAQRQTEAAAAALQIIQRARRQHEAANEAASQAASPAGNERQRVCPPCTGNCDQGDACPARLAELREAEQRGAEARAKVEADAELSGLPTDKWALIAYVAFLGGIVLASHAYAAGWFQGLVP